MGWVGPNFMPPAMKPRSKQETHYICSPIYLFGSATILAPTNFFICQPAFKIGCTRHAMTCPPKRFSNPSNFLFIFFSLFKQVWKKKKKIVNMHIITSFSVVQLRGSCWSLQSTSTLHVSINSHISTSINTHNWIALSLMHLLETRNTNKSLHGRAK